MDINNLFLFLGIVLAVGFVFLVLYLIFKSNYKGGDEAAMQIMNLQKQLEISNQHLFEMMRNMENKVLSGEREMKRSVETQFQESQKLISEITEKMRVGDSETRKAFGDQFESANKLIKEITREITEVKEGNKQVLNIADQLSNLEKVLNNQKDRGNWGESSLNLILSNFLPEAAFELQYMFNNKETVDAVIKIQSKLLPIDSKFSMTNYERCVNAQNTDDGKFFADEFKKDLRMRITETAKYVRENENTLPLAFMFIPSEAIYYDLLAGEQGRLKTDTHSLAEYAQKQKVFIVSPTSIIAYLQLVLSGLKAFNVEENAKRIQEKVATLEAHIMRVDDGYKKLGNSLGAAVNHMDIIDQSVAKTLDIPITVSVAAGKDLNHLDPVL
jgi:DNA recombination protein RmuC